jgi:hypothetical protein
MKPAASSAKCEPWKPLLINHEEHKEHEEEPAFVLFVLFVVAPKVIAYLTSIAVTRYEEEPPHH